MRSRDFTLQDFMTQMASVRKLGPVGKLVGMMPGMAETMEHVRMHEADIERTLSHMRAMYDSMTPDERMRPQQIHAPRRDRIARGAGVSVAEVSQFLAQFEQSRAMMCAVGRTGITGRRKLLRTTDAAPILGLVTDDRVHRDPSYVHRPDTSQQTVRLLHVLAVLFAVAAYALARLLRW
jgi:signal recognition particle GTPase